MLVISARTTALAGLLLPVLALFGGCSPDFTQVPCYRQCEAEGRSFEDIEACRAGCRVDESAR